MSEAEYLELIIVTRDGVAVHVMSFVTILFGYLIMAYLVAVKLTRFQFLATSTVYSLFVLLPINATVQNLNIANALAKDFHEMYPENAGKFVSEVIGFPPVFIVLAFPAWAISIGFAIQQRSGET